MKRNYTEQRFEMNRNTTVIIKTKQKARDHFEHKVLLQQVRVTDEPLNLQTQGDVVDLIESIDLEDDQISMLNDDNQTILPAPRPGKNA